MIRIDSAISLAPSADLKKFKLSMSSRDSNQPALKSSIATIAQFTPGINLERPEPNDTVWYHVTLEPGKTPSMTLPPGE